MYLALLAEANLQFGSVFLRNLGAEVNEGPPEVVNVDQVVLRLVDCVEDSVQSVESETASLVDSSSKLSDEFVDIKLDEFFYWTSVGSFWSSLQAEDVLLLHTLS